MKILILIIFIICIFSFCFILYSSYNEYKIENKKLKDELKNNEKTSKEKEVQIASLKESIELMQQGECNKLSTEGERLREEISQLKVQEQALYNQLNETQNSYNIIEVEIEQKKREAEEITNMMRARVAALQREQNIKENLSDYCLQVSNADLQDIETLEKIKSKLNKPRILCMLIWQTYFQKQLTTLSNKILGSKIVCGIYKITNQLDNQCYIGQSTNIKDRWADHVKCGLGIDTPAGNKLYDAMQRDGVWNFSFELLEECPRASLNEKEKEYIEIYDSYNLGYNSNRGIGK